MYVAELSHLRRVQHVFKARRGGAASCSAVRAQGISNAATLTGIEFELSYLRKRLAAIRSVGSVLSQRSLVGRLGGTVSYNCFAIRSRSLAYVTVPRTSRFRSLYLAARASLIARGLIILLTNQRPRPHVHERFSGLHKPKNRLSLSDMARVQVPASNSCPS